MGRAGVYSLFSSFFPSAIRSHNRRKTFVGPIPGRCVESVSALGSSPCRISADAARARRARMRNWRCDSASMQSPGTIIVSRRQFGAPAMRRQPRGAVIPGGRTFRAVITASGADRKMSSTSAREACPSARRNITAPLTRRIFLPFPPPNSAGRKCASTWACFPRRRAWREIAAQAPHRVSADNPARIGGGSAIIAQIPVSAAAQARQKAAAKSGDRPSGNETRGAARGGDAESD